MLVVCPVCHEAVQAPDSHIVITHERDGAVLMSRGKDTLHRCTRASVVRK
jgi:hypothetical protein